MATVRLYFDSAAIPTVVPSAMSAEWTHTLTELGLTTATQSRKLTDGTPNSALGGTLRTYDTADHIVERDAYSRAFVSDPLLAGTPIPSQTISLCIRASQGNAGNNLYLAWKLFLINSSGGVVASGTLVSFRRDGTPITTLSSSRFDSATSAAVTPSAGDRLCLEIGAGNVPGTPPGPPTGGQQDHDFTLQYGDNSATDLPASDGSTSGLNPWIEFATDLQFQPPITPNLRITQDSVEGLYDDGAGSTGALNVTHDTLEGLMDDGPGGDGSLRVTHDTLEGLYDEVPTSVPKLHITQDTLEGLWDEGDEPPPEEEPVEACPDGLVQSCRGIAGQITVTAPVDGLMQSLRAMKGQIGCD